MGRKATPGNQLAPAGVRTKRGWTRGATLRRNARQLTPVVGMQGVCCTSREVDGKAIMHVAVGTGLLDAENLEREAKDISQRYGLNFKHTYGIITNDAARAQAIRVLKYFISAVEANVTICEVCQDVQKEGRIDARGPVVAENHLTEMEGKIRQYASSKKLWELPSVRAHNSSLMSMSESVLAMEISTTDNNCTPKTTFFSICNQLLNGNFKLFSS